jgi:hypothetical protein
VESDTGRTFGIAVLVGLPNQNKLHHVKNPASLYLSNVTSGALLKATMIIELARCSDDLVIPSTVSVRPPFSSRACLFPLTTSTVPLPHVLRFPSSTSRIVCAMYDEVQTGLVIRAQDVFFGRLSTVRSLIS